MAALEYSLLAKRYAHALFTLAAETEAQEAVAQDMESLKAALASDAAFANFLKNPLISRNQAAKALDALLTKANAAPLTQRFLRTVSLNHRLAALPAMIDAYLSMLAEARGEMPVQVTSAKPLDDAQAKELGIALSRTYGKKVILSLKTDPSLIGGLIIEAAGSRLDESVAGKLNRLGQTLKKSPLPNERIATGT